MDKKDDKLETKVVESEVLDAGANLAIRDTLSGTHNSGSMQAIRNDPPAGKQELRQVSVKNEMFLFAGVALIFAGLLLFFQHMRVGTGMLAMLGIGSQGFGLILLPIMIGIGWVMYDYRNRWGWTLLAVSCAAVIFGILSTVVISFPSISFLGVILMLFPLAAGIVLILKAVGGAQEVRYAVEDELKSHKAD